MTSIRIKNLRLRTYIGFNPDELEKKQDVIVNLEISNNSCYSGITDDTDNILNYRTLTKKVIALVEEGSFLLLEKLAAEILHCIMQDTSVQSASVEVDKPHALRFADSVSVVLSAERPTCQNTDQI